MIFLFLALLIVVLIADWIAVYRKNTKLLYFAKPSIILVLIAASLYYISPIEKFSGFFIAGLIFSLLGDVLLMLPKDRFKFGLISFSAAHICYVIALRLFPIQQGDPIPVAILAVLLIIPAVEAVRQLRDGLIASDKKRYILPVGFYIGTLAFTGLAAISHLYKGGGIFPSSFLLASGALLFIISDLQLAWNRFIEKIPNGRLKIHISYHLAQVLLTIGFILLYK